MMCYDRHKDYPDKATKPTLIVIFLVILFLIVLVRTAWVCDDAYITFRTVDNWIKGYGLRWNINERVQSFTHPLWLLCLTPLYALWRNIYAVALLLSFFLSCATIVLIIGQVSVRMTSGVLAFTALLLSRSFMDYSTSGLENPLTHILLLSFIWLYERSSTDEEHLLSHLRIFFIALIAGLGVLNRMDLGLIFFPALVSLFFKGVISWRKVIVIAAGFVPFVLWELFALLYYGFLFPNTAYAKLFTGIPGSQLFEQGFCYFLDSLEHDPITLFTITGVMIMAMMSWRTNRSQAIIMSGVGLYLVYICSIGGDFMSGRLFSAPLLCSAVILARTKLQLFRQTLPLLLLLVVLGFSGPEPTLKSDGSYGNTTSKVKQIADQRAFYYQQTGLLKFNRKKQLPFYTWVDEGKKAREQGVTPIIRANTGFYGFYAGPHIHIVDPWALSDPLLARLPCQNKQGRWSIGHFEREIPAGYLESTTGENIIQDKSLATFWDKIRLVTRGKIFSGQRLIEIVRFQLGKNDILVHNYIRNQGDKKPGQRNK